jgi:DNA-binding SARP family transcriptional activator
MGRLVLKLLGGFQAARATGEPVELSWRKAQALLAFLALPPGAVHPRDKLAALLWPELPAAQARANLRQVLLALRRALGSADALRLDGDTVALDPDRVEVDAAALERALREAPPGELVAALAGYGGDLLAGLRVQEPPYEEWLAAERERLRECALDGLARLLAHQRARGDGEGAVQTALRLLALDPLQEPVHRTLMRLHVALGRRGDALRQYHLCVSVLRKELEVDPEVETRELYQEILRHRLAPPATETPAIRSMLDHPGDVRWEPVDEVPLVGRASELSSLEAALVAAWSGRPCGVAVVGEAGIGKSRLIGELVRLVLQRGGRVAAGQGYETEQVLPFRPWIEVLRSGPMTRDRTLLAGLTPRHRAALAQLLPEVEEPGSPDRRLDFLRLFEAIGTLVRASASRGPLLVVLEDLHWADEMSLRLLPFLCRQLRDERLLVTVTLRDVPEAPPALLRVLDELRRDWPLTIVPIPPLSRAETTMLAAHLCRRGSVRGDLDQLVWQASRGNPFIVVETLRAVVDAVGDDSAVPGPLPVAAGVRELIVRRLDRLGEAGRRAVTAAAVIGQEFDFALMPRVAGLDEAQAAEGMEELVRHRLLRAVGGRFELVHDRIREIVYAESLAPRRALLHRQVARAIEAVYPDDLDRHVTALATHYRAAGAWSEAAVYLERAGLASAAHSAHRDAAVSFEQALLALGQLPGTPAALTRACGVQFRLGYSLALAGRFQEALGRYEASAALARTLGDERRRALAEIGRASALTTLGGYGEGLGIAGAALAASEAAADVHGQFWAHIQLARIHHAMGDYQRSAQHARLGAGCLRAAPTLEGAGPDYPPGLAWRMWLALNRSVLGEFAGAAEDCEEFHRVLGDPAAAIQSRLIAGACLGSLWLGQGDLERALPLLEATAVLHRQSGITTMLPRVSSSLASAYVLSGRAPEAILLLEAVIERSQPASLFFLFEEIQCRLAEAYLAVGRLADAEGLLGEALGRAREGRAPGAEAEILRALGELASMKAGPDLQGAAACSTAAIALADRLGMRPLVARARLDLGRLRQSQGRSEARDLVARAASEFRDMGMATWLARAEAALR